MFVGKMDFFVWCYPAPSKSPNTSAVNHIQTYQPSPFIHVPIMYHTHIIYIYIIYTGILMILMALSRAF